jgi:hypothetical protein
VATIPALQRGRAKVGKDLDGFEISGPSFVVTGNDEEETKAVEWAVRRQLAFYGSTRDLQPELNRLSKVGDWAGMGESIDDEMLNVFAVVAGPEQVASRLGDRYGDVVTRISLSLPYRRDQDRWGAVIAGINSQATTLAPSASPA